MATHSYRIGKREITYETRMRFAITHANKDNLRVLTFANQGRNHYDTREAAEASLAAFRGPQGLPRVLTPEQVASLEAIEVECYGHGDALGTVFGWAKACRWWTVGDDPSVCLVCEHKRDEHADGRED